MKNLIKQYIKELLFENNNFNYSKTINYLKKKYEGRISEKDIDFVIEYAIKEDPSADKIYSDWILREYVKGVHVFFESFTLGKLNNFYILFIYYLVKILKIKHMNYFQKVYMI